MNLPFSSAGEVATGSSAPFPGICPTGKFQIRNPFRVHSLTWLCRLHLLLHHQQGGSRLRDLLRRWLQRKAYRAALKRTSHAKGKASLLVGSDWRDFSFNPTNSQFESIYAPAFRYAYEPETAVLIDALLPADGVMMDIGANWGHVSLFAASRLDFHGQIHAFEPMPSTYIDLVDAVNATGMGKTVITHNIALANHEGVANMSVPDAEQSGLASFSNVGGSPVQVTRLDLLGLPAPDFMKIDVEGHEANVLRGARETIRKNRPVIIFESMLRGEIPAVLEPFQILQELGYRFFLSSFVRDDVKGKCYTSYGQNEDLRGPVSVALVPFAPEGRWLLHPHLNIFACHAERLPEIAAMLSRTTDEKASHVQAV